MVFGLSASDGGLPDHRGRLHVADITARQMLFAIVEVVGLGVPAGRKVRGKRGVDEPGDGCGVCAAGIPLQGERHELCCAGLTGRITVVVCAAARDGMSRIHGNQAARYGNVDAARDEGVGHRGEPHPLYVHCHMRRFGRELADQMRCKD